MKTLVILESNQVVADFLMDKYEEMAESVLVANDESEAETFVRKHAADGIISGYVGRTEKWFSFMRSCQDYGARVCILTALPTVTIDGIKCFCKTDGLDAVDEHLGLIEKVSF